MFPVFSYGYYWSFWEEIAAPTLGTLVENPPPYLGGWMNPDSEVLVDAALRAALEASPTWNIRVDYSNVQ